MLGYETTIIFHATAIRLKIEIDWMFGSMKHKIEFIYVQKYRSREVNQLESAEYKWIHLFAYIKVQIFGAETCIK